MTQDPTSADEPKPNGAPRLLLSRGLRSCVDGTVSVLLTGYLAHLGLGPVAIGAVVSGTMFGSGVLTLATGLFAHRYTQRRLLFAASGLMAATGLGFAIFDGFWPLFVIALIGTLNPSSGDVSVFLPLEQAALASIPGATSKKLSLFARYNVVGTFSSALGALGAGLPELLVRHFGVANVLIERGVFLVYSAVGGAVAWLYSRLPEAPRGSKTGGPLVKSRRVVLRLSLLFSLDSFGGGFVVQSLLAMWLFRRFQLSLATAGSFFFVASLAGALSQFLSPKVASRIGLLRTMVYTHVPANLFLIAAAFMPNLGLTLLFLTLRASVSSMDVPARQAYVMAVVAPEERAAAASVTNVPRSLAAAISPLLSGMMLAHTSFGWPLVFAGALKITYDLLLLKGFRSKVVE